MPLPPVKSTGVVGDKGRRPRARGRHDRACCQMLFASKDVEARAVMGNFIHCDRSANGQFIALLITRKVINNVAGRRKALVVGHGPSRQVRGGGIAKERKRGPGVAPGRAGAGFSIQNDKIQALLAQVITHRKTRLAGANDYAVQHQMSFLSRATVTAAVRVSTPNF